MQLCESGENKLERQVDCGTIINLDALPQPYRSFTHDIEPEQLRLGIELQ